MSNEDNEITEVKADQNFALFGFLVTITVIVISGIAAAILVML